MDHTEQQFPADVATLGAYVAPSVASTAGDPAPGPNAKRRYTGAPVEEIPAGGDWAETFWIRSTLTFGDVAGMETERRRLGIEAGDENALANVQIILWLAGQLLERWTIEGLPATPANFAALPSDMTTPVFEAVNRFLASKSPRRKSES